MFATVSLVPKKFAGCKLEDDGTGSSAASLSSPFILDFMVNFH